MNLSRRLRTAAMLLVVTYVVGVLGYKALGGPKWSLLDCTYMTVITLATIGYGETHDMSDQPAMRLFTIALILSGLGIMTYFFTTVTAFVIEGELNEFLKRRRMSKGISDLRDHFIVCGAGETGLHVIEELRRIKKPFLVVDSDSERIDRVLSACDLLHLIDDATDDDALLRAGVTRAVGLLACLPNDKDNLFIVITARQLNPKLRIVAKAIDVKTKDKLVRAGADAVVSPQLIGGLRLVSEMVRPHVTGFLDTMLRDQRGTYRVDEVPIEAGSPLAGLTLESSNIRSRTGLIVIAIHEPTTEGYLYNPGPRQHLKVGSTLVVLGDTDQMAALRELASPMPPVEPAPGPEPT